MNPENLKLTATLCEKFGHPERFCPCFHVAGSKGKGTIANGIAAILREKGFKTGVYSSPHVYDIYERFSTGDGPFKPEIYEKAKRELKSKVKEKLPWPVEMTLFAMLVFREAKVDYAVYEVGLGGRLDPTNVISPLAIAMGPVELEHTQILGGTLTKIATEKAGIFKPNVPVISAPQPSEVKAVFGKIEYLEDDEYQVEDAKIAARCVKTVFKDLDEEAAISTALSVRLPGRYEKIENYHGLPYLLMDGAHTENSIKKVLARMKKDGVKGNLIFACAAGKNVEKMAKAIIDSGLFSAIYLTRPGDFKKSDLPRTEKAFKDASVKIYANSDYKALIKKALDDSKAQKLPCITLGSLYLPEHMV